MNIIASQWKKLKKLYRNNSPKLMLYYLESTIEYLRRLNLIYFSKNILKDFPSHVEIETMGSCNARCIMCPNSKVVNRFFQSPPILTSEVYKKLIDVISSHKVKTLALFCQNEPLLDKRIIEFINYARAKCQNTKISINTNAILLSHEISDEILKSGLDHITFSIHGWTEKTMRQVTTLDFKTVLSNITYFIEKAINIKSHIEIGLNCLKTIYFTKHDYDFAFQFSRKYGLPFGLPKATNRAGNINTKFYPNLQVNPKKKIKKCLVDNRPLTGTCILSNGEVVACCMDWQKEEVLGDVYKDSIYQVWHSDRYNEFRARVYQGIASSDNFLCKRCSESI